LRAAWAVQTDVYTTQVQITDDGDNTPPELDNCPTVNNYSQSDYDGDGVGDACDPDPGYPTEDQPGVCVVVGSHPGRHNGPGSGRSRPGCRGRCGCGRQPASNSRR